MLTGAQRADSQTGAHPADSQTGGQPADSQTGGQPADSQTGGQRGDSQTGGQRGDSQTGGQRGDSQTGSQPADSQRGSIAVFTVVFAIAVIFLTALILDGGIAMNAKERAADIAEQAARAAAGNIDVRALRATGVAAIGAGACPLAGNLVATYARQAGTGVDAVTSAAMDNCVAPVGAQTATVQVTITTKPLIPGVLGSFTETAHASATAECGINLGAVC
jgi:Flp pilus assembly protein TadG